LKHRVWCVCLVAVIMCGVSTANAEAPIVSAGAGKVTLPAPTQSMSIEGASPKPYVRTTAPSSIRLPIDSQSAKGTVPGGAANVPAAAKHDIRAQKARQQALKVASQEPPTGSQPKPEFSGRKYVAPVGKGGPIPGDVAGNPFYIVSLPATEYGTTDGFNNDYNQDCPLVGDGSPDVVYQYHADNDQYITVDLCNSSYDTRVYIAYVGDEFTYVACNDDFCGESGWRSRIEGFFIGAGEDILIIVDGYWGDFGEYELVVLRAGDEEENPIVIPNLPYGIFHTTTGYNDDYDEACGDASQSPDVVFSYTPTYDQQVTIDLCGSSYDTKVFVYEDALISGSYYACNEDSDDCPGFQSRLECLQLYADLTYYIIVDGWGNQAGDFYLDMTECDISCWTGCVEEATLDQEVCPNGGIDEVNGGCNNGEYFQPLQPGEIVCGSAYFTDFEYDTDWYTRYLFEGDSVTWCVVSNFPVFAAIIDLTMGCFSQEVVAHDFRSTCDTMYLGYRVPTEGTYAFIVENDYSASLEWPCDLNPQYQAQLIVTPKCGWGFCPLISIPENEGCDIFVADDFNNGCYTNPASFSEVPDNQYVCGLSWRYAGNWDEDAYRRHMEAGETVNFSFQAEFPAAIYVYDVGLGSTCEYITPLDFYETLPCDILSFDVTTPTETNIAFIVLIREVGNEYHCDQGPWEYTLIFNGESECPEFVCDPGATIEGEGCEITATQGYNAGCNSIPPTFATVAYDESVCGTAWYGAAGGSIWRDTDWHAANIADGDSVVWCVSAEFEFDAFIIDVSPDCDFLENITIAYDTGYACDTIYLSTRKLPGQNLKFALAPRFFSPWIWCELGDQNWQATLSKVDESCACDCAHNPICDAFTDILDVSEVVSVAFRNGAAIPDPNGACTYATTDVDCNNFTDILDVTRIVNVAFRNGDPGSEFCDPCVSSGRSPVR